MSPSRTRKAGLRSRILAAISRKVAKDTGESGSVRKLACALCHVDLPVVRIANMDFIQAGSRFLCEAPSKEVCPLRNYLAYGTPEERDSSLPPDSSQSEVHPA
jgi:hypothetical protein